VNLFTERDAYLLPRLSDLVNSLAQYKVFSTFGSKSANHQIPISECAVNILLLKHAENSESLPEFLSVKQTRFALFSDKWTIWWQITG